MFQIKQIWACKQRFGPQMIVSRIETKFSVMLSNRKWTYIKVAPILRPVNSNLCTIYCEKGYRDHTPITLDAIRKG